MLFWMLLLAIATWLSARWQSMLSPDLDPLMLSWRCLEFLPTTLSRLSTRSSSFKSQFLVTKSLLYYYFIVLLCSVYWSGSISCLYFNIVPVSISMNINCSNFTIWETTTRPFCNIVMTCKQVVSTWYYHLNSLSWMVNDESVSLLDQVKRNEIQGGAMVGHSVSWLGSV